MIQPAAMTRRRQAGITLIEVLIAILVLSIGLLGIAGLQTAALTSNLTSYQYTQAAILAQGMVERMRANRQGVINGYYTLAASMSPPSVPGTNCATTTCTPQAQATYDMAMWYAQITGNTGTGTSSLTNAVALTAQTSGTAMPTLSNSSGSITCSNLSTNQTLANTSLCVVTVYWDPGRSATAGDFSCLATSADAGALSCFSVAFQPP
jgi:type IV pilus assembly protein PilV